MALLYGRAGRLIAQNGGSGPGQVLKALKALQAHGVKCWLDIDGGMSRDIYDSMAEGVQVRKTSSWPRSWVNSNLP